jgi:hypothetical protein
MTQAYNLSQLANFVNTSGQLDASAGLDNAVPLANGGTGSTDATNAKAALEVITSATGSQIVPVGDTAERDSPASAGYFRFNTDNQQFEGYNGTSWGSIGGGATGGGGDEVFVENGVTVTTNYTLTTSKNAMSVGPITINAGITVTVPSGQRWVVL